MAYTKIIPIRSHLDRCLNYTFNPEKTDGLAATPSDLQNTLDYTQNDDKTEHRLYVTGFGCTPENACVTMTATKRRWNKDRPGHVLGYHVIQSFSPGEVTPEQAHRIGCEFVQRYISDQYEATVSTHLDHDHLHCHIVFNSVSYMDGKMFRNDFKAYYSGIRKISDELCRENELSVIEPKGNGKQYAEWQAEKQGKPTRASLVRKDVDEALRRAVSFETFVFGLRRMGYEVKYGPTIKYMAVRHKTSTKFIRMKRLGDDYTEEALRQRFAPKDTSDIWHRPPQESTAVQAEPTQPPRRMPAPFLTPQPVRRARYRGCFPIPQRHKVKGFMALYFYYLYLLGKVRRSKTSRRWHYLLRDDLLKFDRYCAQHSFLWEHRIQEPQELAVYRAQAEQKLAALAQQRQRLYKQRGCSSNGLNKQELSERVAALTAEMKVCRKEISLCTDIEVDAEYLREQLEAVRQQQQQKEQQRKEKNNHEHWR